MSGCKSDFLEDKYCIYIYTSRAQKEHFVLASNKDCLSAPTVRCFAPRSLCLHCDCPSYQIPYLASSTPTTTFYSTTLRARDEVQETADGSSRLETCKGGGPSPRSSLSGQLQIFQSPSFSNDQTRWGPQSVVWIDQVECMVTTISEDGERKNKEGTRAREKAGGFSRFLRCYAMGAVIVTALLFGYTCGRQVQGFYGRLPEVHQGAGHRDSPDVSGVLQAGHQSGVEGSAEEAHSADDGSCPSTTAGGRDGSNANKDAGEDRCWPFHKTPFTQEQRKITIFKEPGNHAEDSGEESWTRAPEGRVAYEAETGGVTGMRIVPISSFGFEELWHLWDECHDRAVTFLLMIVGDIVIFLATIMWMILRCRPRSRRLVCISQIRYCRPGKKVKERRFWKPSLLWLLYLQGTHPGALQAGWQVVSAANVPVSSLFTEDAQSEPFDEMVLMAVSGDGTQQDDNVFAPPSQLLMENPEAVLREEANDVNGDEEGDEELQSSEDEGSSISQPDDDDLQCERNEGQTPSGEPEAHDEPQVVRGVDADDWNHVFQFRRHYSMRHCFVRWTTYRNIVSGVAHTWDVSQDDVYAIHDMRAHPKGIGPTSQPVIVQLWGDDLPHEVGVSVLVDLELFMPAHYRESHMRERHVLKYPEEVSRLQIIQLAKADGLCAIRQDRCLVSHNYVVVKLQDAGRRTMRNGDYFIIQVPPLEDCLPDNKRQRFSLLQIAVTLKQTRLSHRHAGDLQALGHAEEAPRDLLPPVLPVNRCFFQTPCYFFRESEWISTIAGADLAVFLASDTRRMWGCQEFFPKEGHIFRDPMEGLPDPGNPINEETVEPEVFQIGSSDEHDEGASDEEVQMNVQVGKGWTDILKLLMRWDPQPQFEIPSCCQPTSVALQFLSGCTIGVSNATQLWIYTDGSYSRKLEISTFAVCIFGYNERLEHPHSFGGWFGGPVETDECSPCFTGALSHSAVEAEASGLIWAHNWLLQSGFMGDVHLCFDSQLAGYGAEGTWTSQSKCSQIGRLREVAQLYRQLRKPSVRVYEHVKAHSGQPANELADALTRACQICPGGRVLILINIAKKILISIVFQYRVLIFQALKSIRKSIKKASKSQPKINTGTAAKMQVVFQIACLCSVGIGNYFVDSCLYMLYTCQNLSHNGPFVKDQ